MNNTNRVYQQSRLYIGDLNDNDLRINASPFPIQRMDYTVSRCHDDNGGTFGMKESLMNLTIALGENSNARGFLEKMGDIEPSAFTVVFGGVFENGILIQYDNIIVFWAYVVDAEESFQVAGDETSNTLLALRMHLDEIKYASKENDTVKILEIHR